MLFNTNAQRYPANFSKTMLMFHDTPAPLCHKMAEEMTKIEISKIPSTIYTLELCSLPFSSEMEWLSVRVAAEGKRVLN